MINLTDKYNKTPYIDVRDSVSEKVYNGNVYCVNVRNHIIMVKRNGVAIWCGNCIGQLTRHRLLSFCIESARYNNYKNGIKIIVPADMTEAGYETWRASCIVAESAYLDLLDKGCKPETARSVLPSCLATSIVCGGNIREWRHVFELRISRHAQVDIRNVMKSLLEDFYRNYPPFFEDLAERFL